MPIEDVLLDLKKKIEKNLPAGVTITDVEFEGPQLVLYTEEPRKFADDGNIIRNLAKELRTRIAMRPDPRVLATPEDSISIIEEVVPDGWVTTGLIVNGDSMTPASEVTVNVKARTSMSYFVKFGNFKCFNVDGYKYNDLDGDGVLDDGEPAMEGWNINLLHSTNNIDWTLLASTTTDANGYYSFKVCKGGYFTVEEETVVGWGNTGEDEFTFEGISGTDRGPYVFLNFKCFSISGYKYEDMLGDGDLDIDDEPVSG